MDAHVARPAERNQVRQAIRARPPVVDEELRWIELAADATSAAVALERFFPQSAEALAREPGAPFATRTEAGGACRSAAAAEQGFLEHESRVAGMETKERVLLLVARSYWIWTISRCPDIVEQMSSNLGANSAELQIEELSEWPSESEAAALLRTSVKTINRYAAKGKIEIRKRPREGKKPENVCHPRDIEKLKPVAHVMPGTAEAAGTSVAIVPPAVPIGQTLLPLVPSFELLIRTISTAVADVQNIKNLNEKLVLTLKEASRSGFSMAFLRRKCEDGSLKSFRDGRTIKIARQELERLANA